ncbi:hypothetical protein Cni_G26261 [Canna indica]|uniref:Uncharacterized protein n=1 Tax=Canna indica TaxID=4628 RepID=A0AAQ3KZC4_9LILI|nr:hypothetical protein Cni_G26261 [Canna indica]
MVAFLERTETSSFKRPTSRPSSPLSAPATSSSPPLRHRRPRQGRWNPCQLQLPGRFHRYQPLDLDEHHRHHSPLRWRLCPQITLPRMIAYAACLEGSDPVRIFDKRMNAKSEPGFVFNKAVLLQYDHMSFGGTPVEVGTEEEAEELMQQNDKNSTNEAEVLLAPPKLVYSNFVLRCFAIPDTIFLFYFS